MDGGFLLVIVVLFAFMYLLLIRPQRQQQARQQDMLNSLKPGDEVITVGGIYGDVVEVEDDRVALEIAEDVEIEVSKRAIASIVPPEEPEESEAEEAEEEPEPDEAPAAAAEEETDLEAAPEAQPDGDVPVTQEEPAGR
jgi:preprotein translocase subunit YajC